MTRPQFLNTVIDTEPRSREQTLLMWVAIFFALVQLIITAVLVDHQGTWVLLFWYCDHISLLYAIAFWRHRLALAAALMYVGIIAQVAWIVDFFGHLMGVNIFNLTNYMFQGDLTWLKLTAVLAHTAVPIVIALWISMRRPVSRSLLYAFDYIIALYAISLLFTPVSENINCVFAPCSPLVPAWNYMILWPAYVFVLVLITYSAHRAVYHWRERHSVATHTMPFPLRVHHVS